MSSLKYPSPGSEESGATKLYFSYGSNMHLQQMAARCRDSRLFAKGILRSYKWQINNRGGANVIEGNQEDFVEGIVFTVSPSDVQALRHYEGVKQQFYAEGEFDIEVERILDTALEGKKPADASRILALYSSESRLTESNSSAYAAIPERNHKNSNSTAGDRHLQISREYSTMSHQSSPEPSTSKAEEPGSVHENDQKSEQKPLTGFTMSPQSSLEPKLYSEQVGIEEQFSHYDTPSSDEFTNPSSSILSRLKTARTCTKEEDEKVVHEALIYVSYEYQLPGDIRDEYIARMQLAMADARMLGVSQEYLATSLHPQVFGKRTGARSDEV